MRLEPGAPPWALRHVWRLFAWCWLALTVALWCGLVYLALQEGVANARLADALFALVAGVFFTAIWTVLPAALLALLIWAALVAKERRQGRS